MKRLLLVPLLGIALVGCAGSRGMVASDFDSSVSTDSAAAAKTASVTPVSAEVADASVPPSRRDVVKKLLSHNVRLFLYDGGEAKSSASGVVVGTEVGAGGTASYVVTNAHALDTRGMKNPELRVIVDQPWQDAKAEAMEFSASVAAVGKVPEMDLALLRVDGLMLEPAPLAEDSDLVPGDSVVVAAAPYGKAVSLSGGLISHVQWDARTGAPTALKTDASIGYGASGGGIYSLETGKLVAIVEGYRTAKVGFMVAAEKYSFDVPMPGETFAAPVSKVRAFLGEKGYSRLLKQQGEGAGSGTTQSASR